MDPDDIPLSYDLITPQWLTGVLGRSYPGAKVISFTLGKPDDGSYNRRRIFLTYDEVGGSPDLPRSVFCKASHALANRLMFGNSGSIRTEVIFYNEIRP